MLKNNDNIIKSFKSLLLIIDNSVIRTYDNNTIICACALENGIITIKMNLYMLQDIIQNIYEQKLYIEIYLENAYNEFKIYHINSDTDYYYIKGSEQKLNLYKLKCKIDESYNAKEKLNNNKYLKLKLKCFDSNNNLISTVNSHYIEIYNRLIMPRSRIFYPSYYMTLARGFGEIDEYFALSKYNVVKNIFRSWFSSNSDYTDLDSDKRQESVESLKYKLFCYMNYLRYKYMYIDRTANNNNLHHRMSIGEKTNHKTMLHSSLNKLNGIMDSTSGKAFIDFLNNIDIDKYKDYLKYNNIYSYVVVKDHYTNSYDSVYNNMKPKHSHITTNIFSSLCNIIKNNMDDADTNMLYSSIKNLKGGDISNEIGFLCSTSYELGTLCSLDKCDTYTCMITHEFIQSVISKIN